jgi:hypothetical protein
MVPSPAASRGFCSAEGLRDTSVPGSSSFPPVPSPSADGQLPVFPQVCEDSSRKVTPTNTSRSAIGEEIRNAKGTLLPALRRAQPVVTGILKRLESAPAPPGAPPDPTTAR